MAAKDISEKILMLYADVFADCENALAYGGEGRLEPEALSLHSLLAQEGTGPEALQMVEDVGLTVHHMGRLPKEVRSRFTSDLGFVVDYLNEGSFEGRCRQKILHAEALCLMMEALTGDTRFTEQMALLLEKQKDGEGVEMCEYIDMLEARGEARGESRGIAIGESQGIVKGESRLARLIQLLLKERKYDDIEAASGDSGRRQEMYRLYGI